MRKHVHVAIAVLGLLTLLLGGCGQAATPSTTPSATPAPTYANVSVAEASGLIARNASNASFVIVDVRTPAEYADGHIAGAVNVDLNSGSFNDEIAKQDKSKTYLVYCRTGVRSAAASAIMAGLGFTRVNNMTGGITDWLAAGYPTVK